MAEFISGPLPDSLAEQAQGQDAFQATTGEVLGAEASNAWNSLPTVGLLRQQQRYNESGIDPAAANHWQGYQDPRNAGSDVDAMAAERGPAPTRNMMQPEDANAQAKQAGAQGLNFSAPMADTTVQSIIDDHVSAQQRASIIDRRAGGILTGGLARFGTDVLVGLADPLNLAAMFVPGAPEAFVAEKFGLAAKSLANRAVVGATQGAAGMAALVPLNYGLSQADMNDFSLGETLRNIAIGAGVGGVLHAGIGALFPRAAADPEVREATLRASIAQIVEGRPVDVAPILEAAEATAKADALAKPKRPGPFEPAAEEFFGKPAEAPDTVRVYHGGQDPTGDTTGTRWVSDDPTYAQGYADKSEGGRLWYADLPADDPRLVKTFDDTGTDTKAPYAHFEVQASELRPHPSSDDFRQQAQAAAQDMVQRAKEPPQDVDVVRSQRANTAAIEDAPKLDGKLEDHIAEATKLAQEAHEAIQAEIAAGRLHPETGKAEFEAAKNLEGDGKAAQAAAACLISRGF